MTDDRIDEPRWAGFPAIMAGIGLVTGVLVDLILGEGYDSELGAMRVASLSFVSATAILFGFVAIRTDLLRSALFALGGGAVAALILYFNGATSGWGASEGWRLFSLLLAIGIAAPLFQAGREGGWRPIPYALAHDYAWTNAVLWCLAWAFTGIVMLLSFLMAALFDLIGIEFLGELLQKGWFWRPLVGLAFGLGLALVREHARIVRMLQNVAMLVLGVLAPVLAVGLGLFLLALPFTGLQPLWEATKATTPILLTCAAGALLLVNAVIGNGDDDAPRHPVLRWAALVLALTLLPLAAIAQVATGLRIGQYGFTPERLWALTFVILASIFAVAYLVCVIRGRRAWAEKIRPANLHLAIITCGVALLLATPLLSFNAISTRDHVARLESGRVAPDKFDWAALGFDFGEPGRAALKRLATSRNPEIAKFARETAGKKSRYEIADPPEQARRGELARRAVRVLPRSVALPDGLAALLPDWNVCGDMTDRGCVVLYTPGATEAFAVSGGCVARPDANRHMTVCQVQRLALAGGAWMIDNRPRGAIDEPTTASLRAAAARDQVEIRPVTRRQVFIGGRPVGDPFE
jgi:hypothetical protein